MSKSTVKESAANGDSGPAGLVTDERAEKALYVEVPGGRIAYEVTGQGPLIVFSHGIGDMRQSYRFLAPLLVEAGSATTPHEVVRDVVEI
jgi:predicted dienelactone hydrolase